YTKREGEFVYIFKSVTPGENIAFTGSDIEIGTIALRKGTELGRREIAVLAALGIKKIEVFKKLRVGVISTGDELIAQGERLIFGKIYDTNSLSILSALKEEDVDAIFLGRTRDVYEEIKRLLIEGLEKCDAIIISGGTSAGAGDIVYRILEEVCNEGILVHGLNIKPGKPTVIAMHNGKPIFGLPGYPVSALIVFNEVVKPYINHIYMRREQSKRVIAKLAERVNAIKGRRWFLPVHLIKKKEEIIAFPIFASSGAIGELCKSDGYIIVREDREFLERGELVEVNLFHEELADLIIMGSNCPALDLLIERLFEKYGVRAKLVNIGSMGGLEAIKRGEADIAGVHLLDPETMSYNEPYLLRMGIPKEYLIKGYKRMQGMMVKKGNPKNIKGIVDLLREDVMFINRNRGSGTRVLIDYMIKKMCKERNLNFQNVINKIRGYRWEAKTHSAVAAAISQGRADVGIGIMNSAIQYGLDFIPWCYEEYDFIINPDNAYVKKFLEYLKSRDFLNELTKMPGYS
ncbi:MAG: molybdopterin biosynthesis protein, partial [Candidatus Methanomethyliaceae archaeon]|nr:molybdopterin biosynthesis protein [Candidatus Methanomethyliaceae archaeon]